MRNQVEASPYDVVGEMKKRLTPLYEATRIEQREWEAGAAERRKQRHDQDEKTIDIIKKQVAALVESIEVMHVAWKTDVEETDIIDDINNRISALMHLAELPNSYSPNNYVNPISDPTHEEVERCLRGDEQLATSGGCRYTFVRGARKGQKCGQPVLPGGQYCRVCAKKKGGGNAEQGGFALGGSLAERYLKNYRPPTDDGEVTVEVVPVPNRPNVFRLTDGSNILVRMEDNGDVIAFAVDENGVERALIAPERMRAERMGFGVL